MLMIDVSAHRAALKKLLWLAVAVGAVLYCRHFSRDEAPGLNLYVEAARCMRDGAALQSCNPTYTYPPIFALVTIPLVPLPMVLQNLAWYALTLGSLIGCFTHERAAGAAARPRRLVGTRVSDGSTGSAWR